MPSTNQKKLLLKTVIIFTSLVIILLLSSWLLLPRFLKTYVTSHDIEWIDRDIKLGQIKFNPLTAKLSIYNTIITEPNSNNEFLSFDKLLVDFNFWDIITKKVSTDKISLNNLSATIIQNGSQFNFSDLIGEETSESEESNPIEFVLKNTSINNAKIKYIDQQIESEIVLDSISILDKSFSNTDAVFDAAIGIHQPEGGWLKADVAYNLNNSDYTIISDIDEFQLAPFKNYVTSVIRLSQFKGLLNTDVTLSGNVTNDIIKTKGKITVDDFHLIDPEGKPLINVGEFLVDIKEVDSQNNIYDFKDILVNNSHVTFEYLPNGDNFTKLLVGGEELSTESHGGDDYASPFQLLSFYIYDLTKEYIFKSYTAEQIKLSNFNLKFYDYTLEDPFHLDLDNLNITAKNIRPENQYANFDVEGKINATGTLKGGIAVSRNGVENMKINMDVNGLFMNRFSPYGRFYTAHRFLEGISSFTNESVIKDSYLTSTNKVNIQQIKVSKKDKTRDGYSMPMRLAVALMKDGKGNINVDIPIEGPINDPEYKFGKVIWQVVKNLLLKVVSSPAKALSNLFKTDIDKLKNIYFDNGQPGAGPKQRKSLDKIITVLKNKKELNITLKHLYNPDYEMDAIALKTAKLEYLKQANLDLDKSVPLGKHAFDLPSTDEQFLLYLKEATPNFDESISIPENARRLVGLETVKQELRNASAKQKSQTKDYLIKNGITENRISIKDQSASPEAINQSLPKFEIDFNVKE